MLHEMILWNLHSLDTSYKHVSFCLNHWKSSKVCFETKQDQESSLAMLTRVWFIRCRHWNLLRMSSDRDSLAVITRLVFQNRKCRPEYELGVTGLQSRWLQPNFNVHAKNPTESCKQITYSQKNMLIKVSQLSCWKTDPVETNKNYGVSRWSQHRTRYPKIPAIPTKVDYTKYTELFP